MSGAIDDGTHYLDGEGNWYRLGCLPKTKRSSTLRAMKDEDLIDKTLWPIMLQGGAGDLSVGLRDILDQGREGTCWEHAAGQAHMVSRVLQGYEHVLLDMSVCPTLIGGFNGNSIDACLVDFELKYGHPPASIIPQSDPLRGLYNKREETWPADWKDHAKNYKPLEWVECRSFSAVATSLLRGQPATLGVSWQGGGHAICALKLEQRGGVWYLAGPNSWGKNWQTGWGAYGPSLPGWWLLSESQVASNLARYGAYAVAGVTPPERDKTPV